jgi:hypothetical protein
MIVIVMDDVHYHHFDDYHSWMMLMMMKLMMPYFDCHDGLIVFQVMTLMKKLKLVYHSDLEDHFQHWNDDHEDANDLAIDDEVVIEIDSDPPFDNWC